MSNTNYTPGPWEVDYCSVYSRDENDKQILVAMSMSQDIEEPGKERANAQLIAAAPELLYTLDYLRSSVGNHLTTEELEMVNNVIAKAEGKEVIEK